jgi:hypothetical protein
MTDLLQALNKDGAGFDASLDHEGQHNLAVGSISMGPNPDSQQDVQPIMDSESRRRRSHPAARFLADG